MRIDELVRLKHEDGESATCYIIKLAFRKPAQWQASAKTGRRMKIATRKMNIQALFAICMASACGSVFAQQDDDFEKKALEECQVIANKINRLHKVASFWKA
jgi:hypothetical protein